MTHLHPPAKDDKDAENFNEARLRMKVSPLPSPLREHEMYRNSYRPKTEDHPPRTAPSPKSAQTASYREPSLPPEEERLRKIEEKLLDLEVAVAVDKAGCGGIPPIPPIPPIRPLRSDEIEVAVSWVFGLKMAVLGVAFLIWIWLLGNR